MLFPHLLSQIYKGDPTTLRHFYPVVAPKLGVFFRFFPYNQHNRGLSGAYVTCIISVKINMSQMLHDAQSQCTHFCFVFVFACVVSKNPKTQNLSPMADDAITRGSIRGLGPPLYICVLNPHSMII